GRLQQGCTPTDAAFVRHGHYGLEGQVGKRQGCQRVAFPLETELARPGPAEVQQDDPQLLPIRSALDGAVVDPVPVVSPAGRRGEERRGQRGVTAVESGQLLTVLHHERVVDQVREAVASAAVVHDTQERVGEQPYRATVWQRHRVGAVRPRPPGTAHVEERVHL